MVPRTGLEPACLSTHAPETCASTNSVQRVIVDLKDKIKTSGEAAGTTGITGLTSTAANVQVQEEAVAALTMLGFAQAPSQKVVMAILKEDAGAPVEQVIKLALKRL